MHLERMKRRPWNQEYYEPIWKVLHKIFEHIRRMQRNDLLIKVHLAEHSDGKNWVNFFDLTTKKNLNFKVVDVLILKMWKLNTQNLVYKVSLGSDDPVWRILNFKRDFSQWRVMIGGYPESLRIWPFWQTQLKESILKSRLTDFIRAFTEGRCVLHFATL